MTTPSENFVGLKKNAKAGAKETRRPVTVPLRERVRRSIERHDKRFGKLIATVLDSKPHEVTAVMRGLRTEQETVTEEILALLDEATDDRTA